MQKRQLHYILAYNVCTIQNMKAIINPLPDSLSENRTSKKGEVVNIYSI
jgi:hypothetical protein